MQSTQLAEKLAPRRFMVRVPVLATMYVEVTATRELADATTDEIKQDTIRKINTLSNLSESFRRGSQRVVVHGVNDFENEGGICWEITD